MQAKRLRFFLVMALTLSLSGLGADSLRADDRTLSPQAKQRVEELALQINQHEKKSLANRAQARDIARQIENLRQQTIALSHNEGVSETRAAIYRAKLESLNVMEHDLTEKLGALRGKEARLLSALQIYSRNPPPAIFISTKRANDAVNAAILMQAITPELKKRAASLAEQNVNVEYNTQPGR